MPQLEFVSPASAEEAVAALAAGGGLAKVLAGGTDLLVQLRSGRLAAGAIVDVKNIAGATGIRELDGGFVIGAATSGAEIGEHEALRQAWPGVVEAATLIGSTQIQSRASMGGNLCNASPAADSAPALAAADATCVVAGPGGRRTLPAQSIAVAPGITCLASGEFILEIRLPRRPPRSADAYLRSIPRTEMDIAVVGVGVSLVLDETGAVAEARVALGAVGPTVILAGAAGEALVGTRLEDDALSALDAAARAACQPISDKRGTIEYRTKIAGVLARRAAAIAFSRAKERA